jgi:hypothetical protein
MAAAVTWAVAWVIAGVCESEVGRWSSKASRLCNSAAGFLYYYYKW